MYIFAPIYLHGCICLCVLSDNVRMAGITNLSRKKEISPRYDSENGWQNLVFTDVFSCWRGIAGFGVRNEKSFAVSSCVQMLEKKRFGE